jgi:hypothetical protein
MWCRLAIGSRSVCEANARRARLAHNGYDEGDGRRADDL